MASPQSDDERIIPARTAHQRRWSPWPYIFGVILIAYGAAFVSVIAIGAGYTKGVGTPTPLPVALVNVATFIPVPTHTPEPATATPRPSTPTPPPPTAPPPPPNTPTPDPNVDFRVPLAASNTGVFGGQRVAITAITDNAQSATASGRPIAGFKFVAIDVLIENLGDTPTPLGVWHMHTTPTADFATSPITGFGDLFAAGGTVAPHALIKGVLVFSVPANARVAWLQYAPNPTARGALYFDAS